LKIELHSKKAEKNINTIKSTVFPRFNSFNLLRETANVGWKKKQLPFWVNAENIVAESLRPRWRFLCPVGAVFQTVFAKNF
jgi:hypothetical protein